MHTQNDLGVTASIPCFRAGVFIRRAVESLLTQTHRNLTVVVVNDADPNAPWEQLEHIRDPRLIRFNLTQNRGPYFAHQVVLGASQTPFFLVQDADDWSSPSRVKALLNTLLSEGSDMAFSAWQQYRADANGVPRRTCVRWKRKTENVTPSNGHSAREPFLFDPVLTDSYINRASHHGIFRRQALEKLGGYYAGFRMNYDTLLTNLLLMTGRVSFVEEPLYNYTLRPDSLSHSLATGARSAARKWARQKQAEIYLLAMRHYRDWLNRKQTSEEFRTRVRHLLRQQVPIEASAALARETARLAAMLQSNRICA